MNINETQLTSKTKSLTNFDLTKLRKTLTDSADETLYLPAQLTHVKQAYMHSIKFKPEINNLLIKLISEHHVKSDSISLEIRGYLLSATTSKVYLINTDLDTIYCFKPEQLTDLSSYNSSPYLLNLPIKESTRRSFKSMPYGLINKLIKPMAETVANCADLQKLANNDIQWYKLLNVETYKYFDNKAKKNKVGILMDFYDFSSLPQCEPNGEPNNESQSKTGSKNEDISNLIKKEKVFFNPLYMTWDRTPLTKVGSIKFNKTISQSYLQVSIIDY